MSAVLRKLSNGQIKTFKNSMNSFKVQNMRQFSSLLEEDKPQEESASVVSNNSIMDRFNNISHFN